MTHLYRGLLIAVLIALPVPELLGQQLETPFAAPKPGSSQGLSPIGPRNIHITDVLLRSPAGQAALKAYLEAREDGTLPSFRSAAVDTVGSEKDFHVQTDLLVITSGEWETRRFLLRAANDVANVWVDTTLTGDFSDVHLDELENYILSETPEDSFRPDRGIIENNHDVFGDPPVDVDPDGIVDVLLYDIEEGNEECCVLGYFSPQDQDPDPEPGEGNASNVLHVDLPNGIGQVGGVRSIAGTIAHEYQHLIHFAYQNIPELTFVNEGMSEWAEVINGYFLRTINYLSDRDEHGTQLFTFRTGSSPAIRENDYQRAGLFTTYIAQRIGREEAGRIVRARCPSGADYCPTGQYLTGETGYALVFEENGFTVPEMVADFHTSNFVNDRTVAERYGYALPQRQSMTTPPTTAVDGRVAGSPTNESVNVRSGAVHYASWDYVTDLQIGIADAAGANTDNRSRASFRLFTESVTGSRTVTELDPLTEEHSVDGDFTRVTLIIAHTQPSDPQTTRPPLLLDVSASWTGDANYTRESIAHDNGENTDTLFARLADAQDIQASAFDVPDGGRLSAVHVAPLYHNQFPNSEGAPAAGAPRDFRLSVWDDDGSGRPGEQLYVQDVEEAVTASHINTSTFEYRFLEIELPGSDPQLANLQDRIFVAISNTGDDDNGIVLASARSVREEPMSYVYSAQLDAWMPMSEYLTDVLSADLDPDLVDQALPIRAEFLVATAAGDEPELPSSVALAQNYPNPFNPTTSVSYSLPRSMHVRLSVYNVLGQRVATLVDGLVQSGRHVARIDASGWASGVYVYALESESMTLSRRMVVLR